MQTNAPQELENESSFTEPLIFVISEGRPAERLDKALAVLLPEHSRSRLQGWIEREHVLVNGKVGTVKQTVYPWDKLTVWVEEPPEANAYSPQDIPFDVLADSSEYIIVNKRVGLVVHPGAGNWQGTLLNGLLFRYPELLHIPRAGIVHRLDKDTSGLMVVARTLTTQTELVRQLQARTVGRRYWAIVHGHFTQAVTIDKPIGRDFKVPVRMSVEPAIAPKPAITHITPLKQGLYLDEPVSLVECQLETGRTHQIRVHMSSIGMPLLGDTLYGGKLTAFASRQMLHAKVLQFNESTDGTVREFSSELPADMQQLMEQIAWTSN